MSLHESMVKHGHTLFRWRSYIPLLFVVPLFLAFRESVVFERVVGDGLEDLWVLVCFIIALAGLAVRWVTVGFVPAGTSGRNTQGQRADALNTTGMYSIVRNPLYLGNFITLLGVVLSIKVWWLVLIIMMGFFIYMERIILAEEKFLHEKYGEEYDSWRERTPVIIPDFKLWQPPALPFSFRTVLKREYQGLLGMVSAFFITEIIADLGFEKEPLMVWLKEDMAWPVIFFTTLAFCLVIRYLKKHTRVLKVTGR
jgi:protein-S-isoprenylcysteine O-methyltransferase Ste14